jgi:hypothetical protein
MPPPHDGGMRVTLVRSHSNGVLLEKSELLHKSGLLTDILGATGDTQHHSTQKIGLLGTNPAATATTQHRQLHASLPGLMQRPPGSYTPVGPLSKASHTAVCGVHSGPAAAAVAAVLAE